MKNIYIKIAIMSGICIQLLGCSIDNVVPLNSLLEENVITNESSAQNFLNRIYNSGTRSNGFYDRSSRAGSNAIVSSLAVAGTEGITLVNNSFGDNSVTQDIIELLGVYQDSYFNINNTNIFIELVARGDANVDDVRRNELLAEARFFRGLSHFNLLRVFGQFYDVSSAFGVVTRDAPLRGPVVQPRSTVQETYDLILSDLQFAADNAPTGTAHFFVSSVTAQAFLARVQLYSGDYTNAASNALAVINNTDGYGLNPDYTDIFLSRWSEETLFAPFVSFDESDIDVTGLGRTVAQPSAIFRALADEQVGTPTDGDVVGNTSGYDPRFIFGFDINSPSFTAFGKYPFAIFAEGNTTQAMRMAEVYLIYAEAEARRPGGVLSDALIRLNDIRNRVGIAPKVLSDRATLLEDIRNEKMLELFFELGESWFDLVRYDRLGDVSASALKPSITSENQLIFPIPRQALSGNPELVPNPGQQ